MGLKENRFRAPKLGKRGPPLMYDLPMRIFKKRETPAQNIAYCGLLLALLCLLSLLLSFLPLLGLFLLLFLPFLTSSVALLCKARYAIAFLLAATILCPLIGIADWPSVLFYLLPGCYAGVVYGYGLRLNLGDSLTIFLTSLLEALLLLLGVLIARFALNIDLIASLGALVGLDREKAMLIFPLFSFAYSLGQTALSHFFAIANSAKLGLDNLDSVKLSFLDPIAGLSFIAISLPLAYFSYMGLANLFFGFALYFAFYSIKGLWGRKWVAWIGVSLVLALFLLFAYLASLFPSSSLHIAYLSAPIIGIAGLDLAYWAFGLLKGKRKAKKPADSPQ